MCILFYCFSLATYDVQNTSLLATNGGICVTCVLAQDSLAKGCHIEIATSNSTRNILKRYANFTRQNDSVIVIEDCILDINSGVYDISVYDINDDRTFSSTPVVVYRDVIFIKHTQPGTTSYYTATTILTILSVNDPMTKHIVSTTNITIPYTTTATIASTDNTMPHACTFVCYCRYYIR